MRAAIEALPFEVPKLSATPWPLVLVPAWVSPALRRATTPRLGRFHLHSKFITSTNSEHIKSRRATTLCARLFVVCLLRELCVAIDVGAGAKTARRSTGNMRVQILCEIFQDGFNDLENNCVRKIPRPTL
jgi:hypothetical protein